MVTTSFLLIASGIVLAEPQLDKQGLYQLLSATYEPLQDVTCEYEGEMSFPQETESGEFGPDGLYDTYSGLFISRRDGAMLEDVYHRYAPDFQQVARKTTAMISGECEEYSRRFDEPNGRGHISPAHFMRLDRTGSLGRIMCDNLLLGLLGDDTWEMTSDGSELVDGRECLVVTFHRYRSGERKPSLSERFWIDPQRGGHALKRETHVDNGKLVNRIDDIVLKQFVDGQGRRIWLPLSGTFVAYTKPGGRTLLNKETYRVLEKSIRLNRSIPDERFSVRYRNGTLITDTLRRLHYEFGQAEPPTPTRMSRADAEALLEEQLALAQAQGDELKAASWARSGPGWMAWAPWGIAIGSFGTLLIVVLRRRFA